MNRFIRIKALVIKESRQGLRDPSSILIAFVLPAILLFLFGYGTNLDAQCIKIGIALESSDPSALRLVEAFLSSKYFAPEVARNHHILLDHVTSGRLRGLLIIPFDFKDRLDRGEDSPLFLATDGSEPNTASFIQNYTAGVLSVWRKAEAERIGLTAPGVIDIIPRYWYNPELESHNSLVPGCLATILAIVGALLTALVVAREWERGTMEALLSTPTNPIEILIGKIIPYFILGSMSLLVCVLVSIFVFNIPFRGGLLALLITGGAFLISSIGQGLLVSTLSKNQFVASQAALITAFLPAFLLSGFIFEIASMPWAIRQITKVIPARYLVTNFRTLFLVGDVWSVFIPNVLFLLIIAGIFISVAIIKSPSRLEMS